MNLAEFKAALYETYDEPRSFYEKDVFETWAQEQSDSGANLQEVLYSIIKNYSYKKFPSFTFYSEHGKEKSAISGGDDDLVYRVVKQLENLINRTKERPAREIYKKYHELFNRPTNCLTLFHKEFIAFWSDFYSLVTFMLIEEWPKEKIAEEAEAVKKALLSGERYSALYHKYFQDKQIETKFTAMAQDDTRHGMSSIDNYF